MSPEEKPLLACLSQSHDARKACWLQGSIPGSWDQLRALRSLWLRPGNYQLCDGAPARAGFKLCKELHDACLPQPSLGQVCDLGVPMALSLPPPTATVTMLQARPSTLTLSLPAHSGLYSG